MKETASKKVSLQGEVVGTKMAKTVVVKVVVKENHPKYHKLFTRTKTFQAHTDTNEFSLGDFVEIQEGRPRSKHKRWVVTRKVK